MTKLLWSGFIILALLSGCGWNGTPTRINDFVPLTSISISANYSTIAAQTSAKLTATGSYSGLFTRDITDQVTWTSSDVGVAAFNTAIPSRVTGVAQGAATLTARVGNVVSTPFTLTVSAATLSSVTITPAPLSIAKGLTRQFTANGTFTGGADQDITFDVTWASSVPAVAAVSDAADSKGFAKSLTVGSTTISATLGNKSDSTLLTVTAPVLQSITVLPANPSILTLSAKKFTASGTYSDGTTSDITSQVAWDSSNTNIATITASGGTATTLSQGTTTIKAALGSVSGTTALKTTGGDLNVNGITINLATATLVNGTTQRITATGIFSNGSSRDITGAIEWTSPNTNIATVTPADGHPAWLNALAVTPAGAPITITAKSGSKTATTTLTVIAPLLQSIEISTTSPELTTGPLTAGTSARLSAIATFNNNGATVTQNVTPLCTWTSDDPGIASVENGGLAAGRVTGVATGTTRISATFTNNNITRSAPVPASVTVLSRNLQNLTISPVTSTITAGNPASYTATANYSDGITKNVTEDTTWSWLVDKANVAILIDSVNQPGQVLGVDSGSATLTANFGNKTPVQNATITVSVP